MGMKLLNINMVLVSGCLLLMMLVTGCNKSPQPVRRLGDEKPDSLLMAQLYFNQRMISEADKQCLEYVKHDTLHTYAHDEFGFWYTLLYQTTQDSLQKGQYVDMHIQIYELNDSLIADVKENLQIGGGELPVAINRALHNLRQGEQIQIIAPWYMAYGVEGTSIIKPYSNLRIVVKVAE
jgi:hypothetical protein